MKKQTIGFIGLGLIGGSIAKSLKNTFQDNINLIAYDTNESTLEAALTEGTIDQAVHQIDAAFSDCSFLFLCAPVACNNQNLGELSRILSDQCILTDVGSVKSEIHDAISNAGLDHCFIGGHPMAGSEKTGFHNATDRLLENAFYILTPTSSVPHSMIVRYKELVQQIGAIPLILSFQEHDYVTAAISHLPHIIASSLVNLVSNSDNETHIMKTIAAGGFKDITRIASSSSDMWKQITLSNKENIIHLLHDYIHSLVDIMHTIQDHDEEALYHFFSEACEYRNTLTDTASGPIKKIPLIYVDIPDKTGIIASIATILASHSISIKNIGIVHNREFEEGALRIEFYDERASYQATHVLNESGYHVIPIANK